MAKKRNPPAEPSRLDLGALADTLRAAGLRRTGPRVAVLARLSAAEGPMTHGALADELHHLGFDRATIYRNLMDLTEAGLVSRSDLGDHVWRFELKGAGARHAKVHPHLVCTECSQVSCLTDVEVKLTTVRGGPLPLRGQELEVQLRGVCERCS
jgi:Fur family ferric uptake transcriptional regulator